MSAEYTIEEMKQLLTELQQLGVMLNYTRFEGRMVIAMTFKHHVEILRSYAIIHYCRPMDNYTLGGNYAMNKYACNVAFTMLDPLEAIPSPDPGYELENMLWADKPEQPIDDKSADR